MSSELLINLAANALWGFGGACVIMLLRVLRLDYRLSGRWEGDLECKDGRCVGSQTHIIRCILVLARPVARQNSGLLYYARECTASDQILVRGLDELRDYTRSTGIWEPEFVMDFTRRFHKHPDGHVDETRAAYRFRCRLVGLLSRAPKLYVATEIPNNHDQETWKGVLQKH